jgi:ubiquinone biosynthesis protein
VPEPIPDLTTRRTLIVEYLDGATLLDYIRALEAGDNEMSARLERSGFEPTRFAANVVDNFLTDAFDHGIFHADLHPANLLILPDNAVGYIDFGITGVLSKYSRRHLIALTLAYSRGDFDAMCAAFFRVSDMAPTADRAGFRKGLNVLSEAWYGDPGEGPRLRKSITLMMMDLLTLSRQTGIWPERDVIKYIRSAIALDGLIKRFAPGFDVGLYLEQMCERQIKQKVRQTVLSLSTLVGWSNDSVELTRWGTLQTAELVARMAAGELSARINMKLGHRRPASTRTVCQIGGVAVLVSTFAVLSGDPPCLGVNLFTAESLTALLSVCALGAIVRRSLLQ